jgi:hypothetical protein
VSLSADKDTILYDLSTMIKARKMPISKYKTEMQIFVCLDDYKQNIINTVIQGRGFYAYKLVRLYTYSQNSFPKQQ